MRASPRQDHPELHDDAGVGIGWIAHGERRGGAVGQRERHMLATREIKDCVHPFGRPRDDLVDGHRTIQQPAVYPDDRERQRRVKAQAIEAGVGGGTSLLPKASRLTRRYGRRRSVAAGERDIHHFPCACGCGVYNRIVSKHGVVAVVDTSFWSAAVHVGVDAYLPIFFDRPLLAPTAVIREVEREGRPDNPRLREDQQRFRVAMEDGRIARRDPTQPYRLFGPGEAACLGLAIELGAVLLVNEAAAYREAGRLGLRAVTVPEMVVRLAQRGHISKRRAHAMLDVLAETTSDAIIEQARRAVDKEASAP